MRHILILRKLSKNEEVNVYNNSKHEDTIVLADPDLHLHYKFAQSIVKLEEEAKKTINYQTLNKILEFGDYLIDGNTVSNHLNFDGAGLWYYHKFRIYFKIRNQNYRIAEIENNIKGASSVIIYGSHLGFIKNQLSVQDVKFISSKNSKKERISITSLIAFGYIVILRFFKSVLIHRIDKNIKILAIDTVAQYKEILALDGEGRIFDNAYLGYLYQKRGESFGFIDQLLIPKFKGKDRFRFSTKALKNHNKRSRVYGEVIMAKAIFSYKSIVTLWKIRKDLNKTYDYLKVGLQSNQWASRLLDELISLHNTSVFYLFKYYAYALFFRRNECMSIITTDENSPNFKIILEAARKNGVYTVGYQHGSIHELHPAYIYSKTDIQQAPWPDFTITWGNKWKEFLISKGNYPKDSVGIAGQIRTDVIKNLNENRNLSKSKVLKIDEDKTIILFATQPQRDPALRYKAAEDVVKACKVNSSVHLIFKLHPRENDPWYYREIAGAHNLKNYTIEEKEELYVLLNLSDIVITCFSTVGTEALYFRKPLVILDHLKQDVLDYHKDGVAFQATNSKELNTSIQKILAGEISIDQKVLENYIEGSAYKIDGQVSERVWELLSAKKHRQN